SLKPEWKLDGVNLLPFLLGKNASQPHETLYWRFGAQMAIRHGAWKLVKYDPNVDATDEAGTKELPKATVSKLYRLSTDVGESHDQAGTNPAKLGELQALW